MCASLVKFQPLVKEIVGTQALYHRKLCFCVGVTLKKFQGHQNLITSIPHTNDVSVLV